MSPGAGKCASPYDGHRAHLLLDLPHPPWAASCAYGWFGLGLRFGAGVARRVRFAVDLFRLQSVVRKPCIDAAVCTLGWPAVKHASVELPCKANRTPPNPKAVQHPGRMREVKEEVRPFNFARRSTLPRTGGHGRSRPGCCAAARLIGHCVEVFPIALLLISTAANQVKSARQTKDCVNNQPTHHISTATPPSSESHHENTRHLC